MSSFRFKFVCQCCGLESVRRLFKTEVERGHQPTHCSWICRSATYAKVRAEKKFLRGLAETKKRAAREQQKKERQDAVRRREADRLLARENTACVVCNKQIGYIFGKPRKYCSSECYLKSDAYKRSKTSDAAKAAKAAAKAKRRARTKQVTAESLIVPARVFEWAGWKCEQCGVETPKELRGKVANNAPELDHIVPLSKGGAHVRQNLQCLCRQCNIKKSDRMPTRAKGITATQVQQMVRRRRGTEQSQNVLF